MKRINEFLTNSEKPGWGASGKYKRPTASQWLAGGVLALITTTAIGSVSPEEAVQPVSTPSPNSSRAETPSPTSSLPAISSPSLPPQTQVAAKPVNPTVVSITDGDTLTLSDERTIRLACIDAPEMSQVPYGEQAKNHLAGLAPIGSEVQVNPLDTDRYGRTVAEVTANGTLVNIAMLKAGQAAVYDKYVSTCSNPGQYYAAETRTQFEAPSVHRHQTRQVATAKSNTSVADVQRQATQVTTTKSNIASNDVSTGGDKDCSDFSTQAEAQKSLLPGDPHRLDRDDDGVACGATR